MFHNIRSTNARCSSKAKMSALSKVEMSVSAPFWEFGGCYFDGHGGDETPDRMKSLLVGAGFKLLDVKESTDESQSFFEGMTAQMAQTGSPPRRGSGTLAKVVGHGT